MLNLPASPHTPLTQEDGGWVMPHPVKQSSILLPTAVQQITTSWVDEKDASAQMGEYYGSGGNLI